MADNRAMRIAQLLQTKFAPHSDMENMYKSWALENRVPQSNDYNMQGFYFGNVTGDPQATSEVNPSDMQMHFTDKWKMPNHPSFSNQSMFDLNKTAPRWVGNEGRQQQLPPYTEGAWGQYGKQGLMNLELPFGKSK